MIGLRTDVDLRLPYELKVEARGRLEQTDVTLHHLPFAVPGTHQAGSATPILQQADPIVSHYVDYLSSSTTSVAGGVQVLARPEALPAVVHCTAGKDRTGIAGAMTLAAVGYANDDIATMYAAGAHTVAEVMARLRTMRSYGDSIAKLPPEAGLTPPDYISRIFAIVDSRYGSRRDYLKLHGVTDDELHGLFERLTEPLPPEDTPGPNAARPRQAGPA